MPTTRVESVAVNDGAFELQLWVPDVGHGPGLVLVLVLVQEIFGVGEYVRATMRRDWPARSGAHVPPA